ncbi:MAG: formylglycine-generating enzyme family protein [Anaerolineales bacterium]|jgi:serine/threonine-protein kinase|nr:formylglycine-generating enzyme family protein [Anaerolineales bacterium]
MLDEKHLKKFSLPLAALALIACSLFSAPNPTQITTPTPTLIPHTKTPAPTNTPSPTPTPGVGSTWTRPADEMVMVYVPAGQFTMGMDGDKALEICEHFRDNCLPRSWFTLEEPVHTVYLDAYWIDQTEVTNDMFARFIAATGHETDAERRGDSFIYTGATQSPAIFGWESINGASWQYPLGPESDLTGLGDHPVVNVSWNDAVAYCEWAGARLPTEAEWEKAARGTDERVYPWGNQDPNGSLANFADINLDMDGANTGVDDGYTFTAPVGSYPAGASPYGALDMAGNVGEFVFDWFNTKYYTVSPEYNPQGPDEPASGDHRGNRGGSWSDHEDGLRTSNRSGLRYDRSRNSFGIRCVVGAFP